ncbi:secondary alcohol dehydrogenase [Ophiostoma piceae UAMH 11346]|uniref:Secondary alcohol dehydrogenase n=1 Tax=Ophiostoma piceae (strain UAMH 11346) TaxID=1262450 RepID=S3C6M5_OPHP1|nr:secondary alcohol dehydrogenase [Ophiostoma piceae UAMH 11346]
MSTEALPISPGRFAEAIKDLSVSTLHLKVLEIRNEITHLDYSNEQLLPFAKGTAAVLGASASPSASTATEEIAPDQDCIDAIQENMVVIERKMEQLKLVHAEVENRGISWSEFQSKEELEQQDADAAHRSAHTQATLAAARPASTAGAASTATGNPWTDGTFQTGTVRNGELEMDSIAGQSFVNGSTNGATGGSLSDDELRRELELRLNGPANGHANGADDDDEAGLHLAGAEY